LIEKRSYAPYREIHSLTGFLRNHKAHVARLKETQAPEVLTVNGKAELLVQDATRYYGLLSIDA
jgi:hypothetical protein